MLSKVVDYMKILIFDIEHATCKDGRFIVCEFGYALFDEYGKLIENNNLLINPQIVRT